MSDGAAEIPQRSQRQDSLDDQLATLRTAAVRLGCYDADDWLRRIQEGRAVFNAHQPEPEAL